MRNEFQAWQEAYLAQINAALEEYLPAEGGSFNAIRRAMRYSVSAGGKRIRPTLTLEFCRIFGGDPVSALPVACAVECLHTYSLIHDDLPCMDDDDFRRGRPSCHKEFGEAEALLAGDALLTFAFELIASAPERTSADPLRCLKASRILAEKAGVLGMVGGQVMDLETEGTSLDAQTLTEIHRLKTSALLEAACLCGAVMAGADEAGCQCAEKYARNLGLAFQTVDDILDVTSTSEELGKPVGSDAENQKVTFVSLYGLEKAKELAEQTTRAAAETLALLPEQGFLLELTEQLLSRRS